MSKGSSYWGTASGKIGNTVVSVVKGQRIERAYQPNVTNPRTEAQQTQRARFANCVKFYRRAMNTLFKFAYEDRKQTESDYNAFMRYNTSAISALLTRTQVDSTYPAIGNGWVLSAGSLGEPTYVNGDNACYYLSLPSVNASAQTIAQLSKALITDAGLQEGDIITLVTIATSVNSLQQSAPDHNPTWSIKQFIVSTTDETNLVSVSANIRIVTGQGLYLDNTNRSTAYYYGVIYSRNTSNGLLVSTSKLASNATALSLYLQAQEDSWITTALSSWNTSAAATLSGAAVTSSISAYILTCSGDSVPRISDTVLDTNVTSTATLTGTDLDKLSVSQFSGVGLRVSGLTLISDSEAQISITGTGSHPYSWILYHNDRIIAQHSQVTATINSVSPSTIDALDALDTATFVITGQYVDALKASDFTSSDEHLVVSSITSSSSTQAILRVTASAQVTSATISYKDNVIITISEVRATITSEPKTFYSPLTQKGITISGTGLDTLNANSFTKPSSWIITDYETIEEGTNASFSLTASSNGQLKFGDTLILTMEIDE